jgi:cell division protein FtsB
VKNAELPLIDDSIPDADPVVSASLAAAVRPRARRRLVGIEAKQRRQKQVRYALLAISAAFMINALVGDNGFLATIKARREYIAVQRDLNAIREENQRLKADMDRLKNDPTAIEEQARKDLGLIRPGETLVIVKDAQPAK